MRKEVLETMRTWLYEADYTDDLGELLYNIEDEFPDITDAEFSECEYMVYDLQAEQYENLRQWEAESRYYNNPYNWVVA